MNTLRQAVAEYLTIRRALGFKLRDAGARLLDFATFMEQQRASYITHSLALAWARQRSGVTPDEWARRLRFVRMFARHRTPRIRARRFRQPGCCRTGPSEHDPTCTRTRRSQRF